MSTIPVKTVADKTWLEDAVRYFHDGGFMDGDTLSHAWIRKALNVPEPTRLSEVGDSQWLMLSRFEQFREHMLEHEKIALRSVRGSGYLIVPPRDQARYAAEHALALVHKGMKHGNRLLEHTRLSGLSVGELQRHTDTQVRLSGIDSMMRRQRKDVFRLFTPPARINGAEDAGK